MKNNEFQKLCIEKMVEYYKNNLNKEITDGDVFIVWICKTLQNNKAMLSTTMFDGMYFELTYNGDKKELYLDAYTKKQNICFKYNE